MQTDACYQIRVRGHLDADWSEWFAQMTIARERDGTTTLTGALADQAALYGVLTRVRNLGLPLISVNVLDNQTKDANEKMINQTIQHPANLRAYTWRSVQANDVPGIYQLLIANAATDKPDAPPSQERIQHMFGMMGNRAERDTRAALAPDGTLAAFGFMLFPPDEDEHLALFDGNVHVAHRGRGIGHHILEWLEARARQEFQSLSDGAPQIFRTSCAAHQTDRIALFEQCGLKPMRYSYTMQRDWTKPILAQALPADVRLERWSPALDLPLMRAFNEAFREHWGLPQMNEELWHQFFTGGPHFRDDLSMIALDGDAIVGFCVNWVNADIQEGYIQAIGVTPVWRGRGLASALMARALTSFRNEKLTHAALDVDTQNPTGALGLYQKHGFETVKQAITFGKRLN
jgi:mycothiol synthase